MREGVGVEDYWKDHMVFRGERRGDQSSPTGYSRTCIKRHRNKRSSCIKRSVVKVPNLFPLDHCNFHLCQAVTSTKRSQSPFIKSQWHVSLSSTCIERSLKAETLKHKPTIIFQEIKNPFFSPKIKVSSIFEQDSEH